MAEPFDLDHLIADTLSRSKEADPHILAKRIALRVPDEELREAFAECLVDHVRVQITRVRMRSFSDRPEPKTGVSRWQRHALALKAQRVFVPAQEAWMVLGDCTADDLDSLADAAAKRAREAEAVEDRYRQLAEKVRAAGVSTLAGLDDVDLGAVAA